MQRRVLIILAVFVALGGAALGVSFMQGAGLERDVSDPQKVQTQPNLW